MKDSLRLFISGAILTISNILGHFIAPTSIFITPIIVPCAVFFIVSTNYNKIFKSFFSAFIIILNDFLIKSFAGGTHDLEGLGFITLFEIPALFFSTIFVIIFLIKNFKSSKIQSIGSLIIYGLTIFVYSSYFSHYGLAYVQQESSTKKESKERGNFVVNYKIFDSIIVSHFDTLWIKEAWIEKEILNDHEKIIKKIEPTGKLYLVVSYKHNAKDWGYDNMPKYFLESDTTIKKELFFRDKLMTFKIDTILEEDNITICWFESDTLRIKIKK